MAKSVRDCCAGQERGGPLRRYARLVGAPNCAPSLRSVAGLLLALALRSAYEDTLASCTASQLHARRIECLPVSLSRRCRASLGALPRIASGEYAGCARRGDTCAREVPRAGETRRKNAPKPSEKRAKKGATRMNDFATNSEGRRRGSSQATTHERQSVRLDLLRATDAWLRIDRSDPDEREPGVEEDTPTDPLQRYQQRRNAELGRVSSRSIRVLATTHQR